MKKLIFGALILLSSSQVFAADATVGWRGNWTGLWPTANPPLEWHRVPKGVLNDLRFRADKPSDKDDGRLIVNGLVQEWLVLGPLPVTDSIHYFDKPQLPDEATVQPAAGEKAGPLTWTKLEVAEEDRWELGSVLSPTADLTKAVGGFKRNQMVYAHTYLHSPRGGTIRAVVEHAHGLKAWVNGKVVYRGLERGGALGNYANLSRFELDIPHAESPRFDLELKPGWNRLLIKVSSYNKEGWTEQQFSLRLYDLPNIPYESKNILWMTELPNRGNATPIIVGDRIFLMAEPDELMCLDKSTGRILWSALNNFYELLSPEVRQANPAFKDKIDPLVASLKMERDFIKRSKLRFQIQKELVAIDPKKFELKLEGHLQSHFGIVGFATPTPTSDGKHVWVWCGNGIAACYDLDGKRRWITQIETDELGYPCSPAAVDGVLAVFQHRLVGLDAATGKVLWQQKRVNRCLGSVLPARFGGVGVFVTQGGDVIRPGDGKLLFRERPSTGDTGWCPPVILGELMYLARYGVNEVTVLDFTGVQGEDWKPKKVAVLHIPEGTNRKPNGRWIDRWSAGSPLVADGLVYQLDIYATLFTIDEKEKKTVYWKQTELGGLFHYNAVPVAASAALIGKHIFLHDNQGTALVVEPGRSFRQVAKNRIGTQLDRSWPIPGQETLTYAPPVPDGNRLYLRGERYLYCIAEK